MTELITDPVAREFLLAHAAGRLDTADAVCGAVARARDDERDAVLRWLAAEERLAYARRSYVAANTLHRAVLRIRNNMHRTGKDAT